MLQPGHYLGSPAGCASTSAIAGDATTGSEAIAYLREIYPSLSTMDFATRFQIEHIALAAGEGTRGIVLAEKSPIGHAFNLVVSNGRVIFLDAGTGGRASFAGYSGYRVLFTRLGGGF